MQENIGRHREPSKVEYAMALAAYRQERQQLQAIVDEVLGKYGKPKITVEELRTKLDAEMGDVSLSQELLKMREEGY